FRFDPLGYVSFAFPWGKAGTSLAGESGPEPWQRDGLETLGQGLMSPDEAVRVAVASGHGSASRRWSPGSSCGRSRRCRTRAASSPPKPTATSLHSSQPDHDKTWRVDVGLHEGVVQGGPPARRSRTGRGFGRRRLRLRRLDAILLERKDDMRKRGLASPDDGDALALTFAYPVAIRDWAEERRFEEGLERLRRWVV
ncbi:MAG: hypothetical protein ACXU9B_08990, partial [Reyranella sp.]